MLLKSKELKSLIQVTLQILKACLNAFYDPNPVIFLEHKGLYWSKVPGTEEAKTVEPAEDYILPFGKPIL
jgi:pyruvate/2-oxoglutarate/acetoin dehydrogenase E1 component